MSATKVHLFEVRAIECETVVSFDHWWRVPTFDQDFKRYPGSLFERSHVLQDVVNSSKNLEGVWTPFQNGKPVEMEYTLEVNFKLDKEKQDKRQGALNYNTKGITPLPSLDQVDAFITKASNLSVFKQFTDVAYGGAWSAIPRMQFMKDTTQNQMNKYRYFNYSDADLMIRKAPKKYQKLDWIAGLAFFWS